MSFRLEQLTDGTPALVLPLPDELAAVVVNFYGRMRTDMLGETLAFERARALSKKIREQRLDLPPDPY